MTSDEFMQVLGEVVEEVVSDFHGEKMGFALLVFQSHTPRVTDYVSNAVREDMVKALRESADRLEAGEDMPPTVGEMQ